MNYTYKYVEIVSRYPEDNPRPDIAVPNRKRSGTTPDATAPEESSERRHTGALTFGAYLCTARRTLDPRFSDRTEVLANNNARI